MSNTFTPPASLMEKWAPVLNEESAGVIKDRHRKAVTAMVLENQEQALAEQALTEGPTNAASAANWDPILIALARRAMPNMLAFDVAGVQPMSGPTGLIFAMRSRYDAGTTGSDEALFNEAVDAEELGSAAGSTFKEMGFTIEKATVTARTRALKAEYSLELAQDLKAIHGLDAESELANILSTEILAEIDRETIRTINGQAVTGATTANTKIAGIFDMQTDADGRWSIEKFKGLIVQIEREANAIAKATRRGKGNWIICSSDVASALASSGMLDYSPAMTTALEVDDTGNTFCGTLNGRTKVYIDPYATTDYVTVGYKGTNAYDAGLFYCPYVPLTMVRAVGENDFQPKIGFKTRYGMTSNPFVGTSLASDGLAAAKTNSYFRIFRVDNIMHT